MSREISPPANFFSTVSIVLKFCTYHDNDTVMFCIFSEQLHNWNLCYRFRDILVKDEFREGGIYW